MTAKVCKKCRWFKHMADCPKTQERRGPWDDACHYYDLKDSLKMGW